MMIHMFSGQWPEPQVGPVHTEADGTMIPISEAERREVFLRTIGNDHPLMDLILKCIYNHSQSRAHASEIVERLAEMVLQFPSSFTNRLEMLRQIETIEQEILGRINVFEEEKRALTEDKEKKDRLIQELEAQIALLRKEATANVAQFIHSSEVEHLRLQVRDLTTQNKLVEEKSKAEIAELKSTSIFYQIQTISLIKQREDSDIHHIEQLAKERETNRSLKVDVSKLKSENDTLSAGNFVKDDNITKMNSELEAKNRALAEKDAIISAMSEQLTKAREYLTSKQQVGMVE